MLTHILRARVKAILDDAAGGSPADGGAGGPRLLDVCECIRASG